VSFLLAKETTIIFLYVGVSRTGVEEGMTDFSVK